MVLLQINTDTLTMLEGFPYLGRMITYNRSDWAKVYLNLRKYWRRRGMVARVLESMGATVRAWGEM